MTIVPYSINYKTAWDGFVRQSKNGTFLLLRDFMDYHADRFFDCSLLIYEGEVQNSELHSGQKLKALFPANWVESERTVYTHQGLTYGGIIMSPEITQSEVLAIMQQVLQYYRDMLQAVRLIYKPIPYIYSPYPSDEDLYAIFRAGGRLKARAVSTVVCLDHQLRMRNLRRRQAKKALDNNFYIDRVMENDRASLHEFWSLLTDVLEQHHAVRPVHSEEEIALLMRRFPREIRMLLIKHEQRITAGCVVFLCGQVAHVQYIAAGDEGREFGALDLLFRHLIMDGYRDLAYLDFGISTEHGGKVLNTGLIFQKEGFGGRAVCYDTYEVSLRNSAVDTMMGEGIPQDSGIIKFLDLKAINDSFEPEMSEAVERVLTSGRYILGDANHNFEAAFSQYCGTRHCIMVGNGLEALTLILRAYKELRGWDDGDEVIVPANTFIATILAIVEAGLRPVLCEPSMQDYLIDISKMKELLTGRTRVVMPVHLYGRVCDMNPINEWARANGLLVVEDAAQAHGACYKGQRTGHLGDAAGFSFYPGKNLGAFGDSGCVTTDDDALAETVRMMSNYGSEEKYICRYKGMNSRTDELQAAVLSVKLPRLDEDNARRREVARLYLKGIQNPLITMLAPTAEPEECVYHVFPIRCPAREQLQEYLKGKGIQTLIHYPIPPHKQKAFSEWNVLRFPITERIHREILSLPISPLLTGAQVNRIIKALNEFNVEL